MSLSPNRQWTEVHELIEKGIPFKACEVFNGDKYIGTFISNNPYDSVIGSTIRTQADYLALRANSVFPADSPKDDVPIDKFPNLTKARETLRAKRDKVKV